MALGCPVCGVELHPIANRTGLAAVCGSCGGVWLDNESSRSVVKNFLEPAIKQTARAVDEAMSQRRAAPAAGGYRTPAARSPGESKPRVCPQCGGALAPSHFAAAGIMLDVCGAHGTWFDAGELWAMTQHFEMKAFADDADADAFGREIQQHRRGEALGDLRMAGALMGFLRR
jgi:Zn-finger nucleic acid-binding protein